MNYVIYDEISDLFLSDKIKEEWGEFYRTDFIEYFADGTQMWYLNNAPRENAYFTDPEEAVTYAKRLKASFLANGEEVNFTIFSIKIEFEQVVRAKRVISEKNIGIMKVEDYIKATLSVEDDDFKATKLEADLADLIEEHCHSSSIDGTSLAAARRIILELKKLGHPLD